MDEGLERNDTFPVSLNNLVERVARLEDVGMVRLLFRLVLLLQAEVVDGFQTAEEVVVGARAVRETAPPADTGHHLVIFCFLSLDLTLRRKFKRLEKVFHWNKVAFFTNIELIQSRKISAVW